MFLPINGNGLGVVGGASPRALAMRLRYPLPAAFRVPPRRRGMGDIGFGPGQCPMLPDGRCTTNPGSTNAADYFDCATERECAPYTGRAFWEFTTPGGFAVNSNIWTQDDHGAWVWLGPNGTPAAPPAGSVPPDPSRGAFPTGPTYNFGGGGSGGTNVATGYTPIAGTPGYCRDNHTGSVIACPSPTAPASPTAPSEPPPPPNSGGCTPGSTYVDAYGTSRICPPASSGNTRSTQEFPRSVAIVNTTRGGSGFVVGDNWAITVKGDPGKRVTASATQDGASLGSADYGVTDASGVFVVRGVMTPETVGRWAEQWKVDGATVGSLSFTVTAQPSNVLPPVPPGGAGGNTGNQAPGLAPAGFNLSFIKAPINLFGFTLPAYAVGAIALGGLYLFSKGRR